MQVWPSTMIRLYTVDRHPYRKLPTGRFTVEFVIFFFFRYSCESNTPPREIRFEALFLDFGLPFGETAISLIGTNQSRDCDSDAGRAEFYKVPPGT
jgi:hypothetical protein